MSNSGNIEWTKLFGTSNEDQGEGISISSDGSIYITGYTKGDLDGQKNAGDSDAYISKYNSNGDKIWTRLIGSSKEDIAFKSSISSDGSIYITGYTKGNLDGQKNAGPYAAYISKFTSDGDKRWTRLLGGGFVDSFTGSTVGSDGSIYCTGGAGSHIDGQTNAGSLDVLLSKFDSNGNKL